MRTARFGRLLTCLATTLLVACGSGSGDQTGAAGRAGSTGAGGTGSSAGAVGTGGGAGAGGTGGSTGAGGTGGSAGAAGRGGMGGAGGAVCAFDAVYTYGDTGGVVYGDHVRLAPPADYQHVRVYFGGAITPPSCEPALPSCNTGPALDVDDIMLDIENPDVQAALAIDRRPLYGVDAGAADGSTFSFERADNRGFLMGKGCPTGSIGCLAIPPGVAKLAADLRALDQQQLQDASCAALR